jgi:hypothetical protein
MKYFCPNCGGRGCALCAETLPAVEKLKDEARKFLEEQIPVTTHPYSGERQMRAPGSYQELLLLVAAAIWHGIEMRIETPLAETPQASSDRFGMLEIED